MAQNPLTHHEAVQLSNRSQGVDAYSGKNIREPLLLNLRAPCPFTTLYVNNNLEI
jgi:hypothetical protein